MTDQILINVAEAQTRYDAFVEARDFFRALEVVCALSMSKDELIAVEAIARKAHCFDELDAHDLEILAYKQGIERFKNSDNPSVRSTVNGLLYNLSISLGQNSESQEALKIISELRKRLRDDDVADRITLAQTMFNELTYLLELGRSDDFNDLAEEMVARFKDDSEGRVRTQAGRARAVQGEQSKKKDDREALRFADEALGLIEDTTDVGPLLVPAIKASRAVTVARLGDLSEAEKTFAELETQFGDPKSSDEAQFLSTVLYNRCHALKQLGRTDDAAHLAASAQRRLTRWRDDDGVRRTLDRLKEFERTADEGKGSSKLKAEEEYAKTS